MQTLLPKNSIIGTLGPNLSFHDIVRIENYNSYSHKFFNNFNEIFAALKSGVINAAIIAVENSIHGTVEANSETIIANNFKIVASHKLPITLHLAVKSIIKLNKVKRVYAHKIAWNECLQFLANMNVTHSIATSNAQALKDLLADNNPEAAAISGQKAIEFYGLTTLVHDIHDVQANITTFKCITNK